MAVNAEKIEDLYLACKDNITTVNEGTFENCSVIHNFYFKLKKQLILQIYQPIHEYKKI